MSDSEDLFQPVPHDSDDADMTMKALHCVEAFAACFNARDSAGMDSCLHFPHIILSGEHLVIWSEPGQISTSFFEDLERDTGWVESRYVRKEAVLVSPRKVHLLVEYSRNRADGSVASKHCNIWIVTFDAGRWGIKLRSY